jgi:hypothetical protein
MAAGDISLTTPKVLNINSLVFVQVTISPTSMEVILQESATGTQHRVFITNASCTGIDLAAGVFTDNVPRVISNELTRLFGLVLKASPLTTLISTLQTDGVITVAGAVG